MQTQSISLEILEVPNPCPADWNAMAGDDQMRFCKHCSLHVFNLSNMTRAAGERLVAENQGHLCVRMYKRADGTVVTADCGGGLRKSLRLATSRLTAIATTAFAIVATVVGFDRPASADDAVLQGGAKAPPATQPVTRVLMGDVMAPPPQATPAASPAATNPPATRPVVLMGSVPAPTTRPVATPALMEKWRPNRTERR